MPTFCATTSADAAGTTMITCRELVTGVTRAVADPGWCAGRRAAGGGRREDRDTCEL